MATAIWIDQILPENASKTVALRQLLESKDTAIRAIIFQEPTNA
jgi:hypothetical protein